MDQQKNHLEAYFKHYMQEKHAMFFKYTLKVAPYAETKTKIYVEHPAY